MNARFILILLITGGWYQYSLAQSTWIGNMPLQFNPSFAGSSGDHRISALFPYRILALKTEDSITYNSRVVGTSVSYDNFLHQISSGIGFSLSYTIHDALRLDGISEKLKSREDFQSSDLNAAITVSPKLSIKGKFTLAPSIQLLYKYTQRNNYYIERDISVIQPIIPVTKSELRELERSLFSLTAGMLFNTKKLYLGYSVFFKPIGRPILYTLYDVAFKPRSIHFIQAGYRFQKSPDSKFSVTPQLVITISPEGNLKLSSLDLYYMNVSFRYKNFIWGISNTSLMAGYQNEKIRIAYIQELFGIDSPINNTAAHRTAKGELSFRIIFPKKNKTFFINT
jgi:hypothetical protein